MKILKLLMLVILIAALLVGAKFVGDARINGMDVAKNNATTFVSDLTDKVVDGWNTVSDWFTGLFHKDEAQSTDGTATSEPTPTPEVTPDANDGTVGEATEGAEEVTNEETVDDATEVVEMTRLSCVMTVRRLCAVTSSTVLRG